MDSTPACTATSRQHCMGCAGRAAAASVTGACVSLQQLRAHERLWGRRGASHAGVQGGARLLQSTVMRALRPPAGHCFAREVGDSVRSAGLSCQQAGGFTDRVDGAEYI